MVCLDYVLRKAFEENLELGLTLTQQNSRQQAAQKVTEAAYANDLEMLADHLKDTMLLLHSIENIAKVIRLYVNAEKTEFLNQDTSAGMKTLSSDKVKQVDDFKSLGSYIASTE